MSHMKRARFVLQRTDAGDELAPGASPTCVCVWYYRRGRGRLGLGDRPSSGRSGRGRPRRRQGRDHRRTEHQVQSRIITRPGCEKGLDWFLVVDAACARAVVGASPRFAECRVRKSDFPPRHRLTPACSRNTFLHSRHGRRCSLPSSTDRTAGFSFNRRQDWRRLSRTAAEARAERDAIPPCRPRRRRGA